LEAAAWLILIRANTSGNFANLRNQPKLREKSWSLTFGSLHASGARPTHRHRGQPPLVEKTIVYDYIVYDCLCAIILIHSYQQAAVNRLE